MTSTLTPTQKLEAFLKEQGYSELKPLPDGTYAGLQEFIFTTGLMTGLNEKGYHTRYCYESHEEAFKALEAYSPATGPTQELQDPTGPWIKAKGVSGDRLNPQWCAAPEVSVFKEDKVSVESTTSVAQPKKTMKMSKG